VNDVSAVTAVLRRVSSQVATARLRPVCREMNARAAQDSERMAVITAAQHSKATTA